jgi:hypothetical protein
MTPFNPKDHLTKIGHGKEYLEVKWRIFWMRSEHPDWAVDTVPLVIGDNIVVKATVQNDTGAQVGSGLATVRSASSSRESWAGREFEKAETAAIGRALAVAGYGTQFTDEEFSDNGYLADSPTVWPSIASLKELFDVTRRKLIPGATDVEIAKLAGIDNPYDLTAWGIYPDRTAAANAIKAAWDPDLPGPPAGQQQPLVTDQPAPNPKPVLQSGTSTIVAAEVVEESGHTSLMLLENEDDTVGLMMPTLAAINSISPEWASYAKTWQPGQRITFALDDKPPLAAHWKEITTVTGRITKSIETISEVAKEGIPF